MGVPSQPREFFSPLESLRGLAALGVALMHMAFAWTFPGSDVGLIRNGYLLVDVFFVLSGFVICHSYGNRVRNGRDLARFIWMRLGRLYPLHLTFLLVFLGFEAVKYAGEAQYGLTAHRPAFSSNDAPAFVSHLLLLQGLGLHGQDTYNLPSWSISTEFYTYLIFAAVVLFIKARTGIVLVAGLLVYGGLALDSGGSAHNFFRCVEGFFVGVITYYGFEAFSHTSTPQTFRWSLNLLALGSFAGLIAFVSLESGAGIDPFVLPLVSLLVFSLACTPREWVSRLLMAPPLAWLGKVSYSIYMAHMAVIWCMAQLMRHGLQTPRVFDGNGNPLLTPDATIGFLGLLMAIASLLLLSHAVYTYIENPCRRKSRELAFQWFPASPPDGETPRAQDAAPFDYHLPDNLGLDRHR